MKKLLVLLLTMTLLASTACSSTAGITTTKVSGNPTVMQTTVPTTTAPGGPVKTGLPVVANKITLKALVKKYSIMPDWNGHPATNELEARTNIHIDWECVPDAGFDEKRNLLFASSQLPDMIMRAGISTDLEIKYAASKQLVALDKLFDYAPYLTGLIKENPTYLKNIQSPDGHVYSVPQIYTAVGGLVNKYWINDKWLKNLNLKPPTTTEELYTVLKAFVEKDANGNGKKDELGLCGPYKSPYTLLNYFHGSWGLGKNAGIIANYLEIGDNGKMHLIMTDAKFKDELSYFHKLWAEGLMDKDCFSQDVTQVGSKSEADLIGFCANMNNTQFLGSKRDNYVMPPVLKGPSGDAYWVNVGSTILNTGVAVITSANKYPEATMRWLDYIYSEEGTRIVRLGIEGKSYKVNTDGTYSLLDEIKKDPTGLTQDEAIAKWSLYCGGGLPQNTTDKVDLSAAQLPEMQVALKTILPSLIDYKKIPRIHFTAEESTRLSSFANDIKTYIDENVVKFITGQRDLSTWDTYVGELDKMKIKEFIEVYQTAYDRWLKG